MSDPPVGNPHMSLRDVWARYEENAAYRRMKSPDMALLFMEAIDQLILRTPQFSEHGLGSERLSYDIEQLRMGKRDAQIWLEGEGKQYSRTKGVRYGELRHTRGWISPAGSHTAEEHRNL